MIKRGLLLCCISFGVIASVNDSSSKFSGEYIAVPIAELEKNSLKRIEDDCNGCLGINFGDHLDKYTNGRNGFKLEGVDESRVDDDDGVIIPIRVTPLPSDFCVKAPKYCE